MSGRELGKGEPEKRESDKGRSNGEPYRRLFEDAQEGIAISTTEGEIEEVNAAAAEIFGYSQEELCSMNTAELYVDPKEQEEAAKELEKKGTLEGKELRLRRADGEEIVCRVSTSVHHSEEGAPKTFQTFFRDVTERKRAEEALKESEKRYRRLFEESRDAVILTTPDGDIVDANGAAEELFGYSREEFLSLDAAELYAAPGERGRRIVPELKEATSSRLLEAEMRHSKGHTFLASAAVTVHRGEEGQPELIQALVRDITDRKQREKELAAQKQEIENQKRRAEQKNALLQIMQRVASAANEAEELDEALQEAVDATTEQTSWSVGHVYLRDEYLSEESLREGYFRDESPHEEGADADEIFEDEEAGRSEEVLRPSGIWNREIPGRFEPFRKVTEQTAFASGEGLPGQVLLAGEPVWIEDVTEDETCLRSEVASEVGIKGAFAFPVSLGGEVIAVIEFYFEEAKAPGEDLLEAMESVGNQLSRFVERKEAIRALTSSEKRYRRLFEEAQEGIGISTPEGEILDVNPAALEIFGYSREELRSMRTTELYVDPKERQASLEELQEKGAIKGRELRLYRASGEEFVCRLSATILHTEEGEPQSLLTFFRDVTERVRAEEALRESEEMFRKLAENATVGIGMTQEGTYEYVNPALEEITGYSREELLGKSLKRIVHPDDWPKVQEMREKRLGGERLETPYEIRIRTKSGKTRLVEVAGSLIDYQGKPAVIGTVQDITERRELQREVLNVQEEERRRLGQELHDGVASQLTGANIMLGTLSSKIQAEKANEYVQKVQEIINESASDMRRLSRGLNPGGLSEGDLSSALEGLAESAEGAGFETEGLESEDAGKDAFALGGDVATHLYRIAQEAVSNARQHGGAEKIEIRLTSEDGELVLEIKDNGMGFHPSEVNGGGLGLRSMRHRAELLGADLVVESSSGEGTLVRVQLPL